MTEEDKAPYEKLAAEANHRRHHGNNEPLSKRRRKNDERIPDGPEIADLRHIAIKEGPKIAELRTAKTEAAAARKAERDAQLGDARLHRRFESKDGLASQLRKEAMGAAGTEWGRQEDLVTAPDLRENIYFFEFRN